MTLKNFTVPARNALAAATFVVVLGGCGGGGASRYQGVAPDELFAMATERYEAGDHGDAIQILDRILIAHGDWERIPEARLMLGDVYYDRGDYLTARSEYQRFIDRYSGHPRSVEAALGICRSLSSLAPEAERDQGYTQEAITSCRNVVIDFAGNPVAQNAARISNELRHTLAEKEFQIGEFYYRRKLWDAAIKYYEFTANLYPESEYAPAALLGVYRANMQIGYEDLAEEARTLLLQRYPESDAAAEVQNEEAGDPDGDRG